MKLLVDDRIGSRELLDPLRRMGVPVRLQRLAFGDFAFRGHGPNGSRLRIGVERKTVDEMLQAKTDSRFVGRQLPGLLQTYRYTWLVVEGYTRVDPRSGLLMRGKWAAGRGGERHAYDPFKKYLLTLETKACLKIETTAGFTETCHFLCALYSWWQKPWNQHKSAYKVEESQVDTAILDERTMRRQTFAQWPEIGWVRSKAVAQHFPSIISATSASVDEWCELVYRDMNGKRHRLGPNRAMKIVDFLNGKEPQHAKGA